MVSSTYVFFRGDLPQSFRYLFTAEGPGALIPSATTGHDMPLIRILIKYACAEWTTIWENIPSTPLCDETRSTWYRVVTHYIISKHKTRGRMSSLPLSKHCSIHSHRYLSYVSGHVTGLLRYCERTTDMLCPATVASTS